MLSLNALANFVTSQERVRLKISLKRICIYLGGNPVHVKKATRTNNSMSFVPKNTCLCSENITEAPIVNIAN